MSKNKGDERESHDDATEAFYKFSMIAGKVLGLIFGYLLKVCAISLLCAMFFILSWWPDRVLQRRLMNKLSWVFESMREKE